nr:LOW QUALITY PROTEIN: putative protein SEM1 [Macaca fascicularis]
MDLALRDLTVKSAFCTGLNSVSSQYPCTIHVHQEPQNVTLLRIRVFADTIKAKNSSCNYTPIPEKDPNVCAVFAVQGGKVGRKHGIKRGRRPSMQNPAQQARGPWIHESKHPAFAKQQINLEMPSSGVTTERACVCSSTSRKKNWAGSLTLPTAPLSPAPSLVPHCEDCSCLPGCHLGDLYNLATAERTCWQHINSRDGSLVIWCPHLLK